MTDLEIRKQLKTLMGERCEKCGSEVNYKSCYCQATQDFWFDGFCTNKKCDHQTDIVPAGWEREEG